MMLNPIHGEGATTAVNGDRCCMTTAAYCPESRLAPLGPQSRFGDKLLEMCMVCPQNGTPVLKGLGYARV